MRIEREPESRKIYQGIPLLPDERPWQLEDLRNARAPWLGGAIVFSFGGFVMGFICGLVVR